MLSPIFRQISGTGTIDAVLHCMARFADALNLSSGYFASSSRYRHLRVAGAVFVVYVAAVLLLLQAIAAEVRVSRLNIDVQTVNSNSSRAEFPGACSDASGLDRKLCAAENRIDTAREQLKQKLAARRSPKAAAANLIWQADEVARRPSLVRADLSVPSDAVNQTGRH